MYKYYMCTYIKEISQDVYTHVGKGNSKILYMDGCTLHSLELHSGSGTHPWRPAEWPG